jgi:hypothetical protein
MPSEKNIWISYSRENLAAKSRRSFPFIPGLFFISLGILVVLAPRLVIAALAGILLFVGALLCLFAYKFMQFQKKITSLSKQMESKVQFQGFEMQSRRGEEAETKKIVFH